MFFISKEIEKLLNIKSNKINNFRSFTRVYTIDDVLALLTPKNINEFAQMSKYFNNDISTELDKFILLIKLLSKKINSNISNPITIITQKKKFVKRFGKNKNFVGISLSTGISSPKFLHVSSVNKN